MANWGSKCCYSSGAEGGGQGRASENRTILSVSKEVVLWLYAQRGQFIEKWKPVRFKEKKKEASIFGENENPNRNFEEKWGRNSKNGYE